MLNIFLFVQDELEREEFFRLKKVQDKKKRIRKAKEIEEAERKLKGELEEYEAQGADILAGDHDEDVLF